MSDTLGYDALLDKAKGELPDIVADHERFTLPELDVIYEGNSTIIKNFGDIVKAMNRKADHVVGHLLKELGTAGHYEGGRLIFNGKIKIGQIKDRIESYMDTYILCSECYRPDTKIVKEGRVTMLVCEACGAKRPVRIKKRTLKSGSKKPERLEEGDVKELVIEDVGRKGDGIGHFGKYTIYVPGTTRGQTVKVLVEKIRGSIAFGRIAG